MCENVSIIFYEVILLRKIVIAVLGSLFVVLGIVAIMIYQNQKPPASTVDTNANSALHNPGEDISSAGETQSTQPDNTAQAPGTSTTVAPSAGSTSGTSGTSSTTRTGTSGAATNAPTTAAPKTTAPTNTSSGNIVNRYSPYTSKRVYNDLAAIAKKYPNAVSLSSIGTSTLGKDIPLVKLGHGSRKVLWVGGIHAREVVTVNYLMLTIEEYAKAYHSKTAYGNFRQNTVQRLLDTFTVYIVPMCNPDGTDIVTASGKANVKVTSRREYKSNANGVNLNRNFPFDWENSQLEVGENEETNRGPSPASEKETKALMQLCRNHKFEHLISCHAQGQIQFWADEKNGTIPGARALADTIYATNGYYPMAPTSFANGGWAGGFENWFRLEFNRPGICVEFAKDCYADAVVDFDKAYMIDWARNKNLLFEVLYSIS